MYRLFLLAVLVASACAPAASPTDLPRTADDAPERLGVRSAPLADLIRHVRSEPINLHHVSILRRGEPVLSADFYPYTSDVGHDVASVTKSITSTLVGIAIDRGEIPSVDAPVVSFFPGVPFASSGGRMERLTLKHLLTMTSGFCSDFGGGEAQLDAMRTAPDAVRFMLAQPLLHEPGEHFAYCSGASQLLSAVVTQATGQTMHDYARAHLFGPLGIGDVIWPADPQGNNTGWGDLFIRPLDLAKIGQLFLQRGEWNGTRIVSQAWIDQATTQQVADGDEGYGYRWWIPNSVPGLYEGRGRGGQRLVVWPDRDLVVVMIGSGFDPGALGGFIVDAVSQKRILPPDPQAFAALQAQVAAAAAEPPPGRSSPISPLARTVSGVRYDLAPNEVGLTHVQLDFCGRRHRHVSSGLSRRPVGRVWRACDDGRPGRALSHLAFEPVWVAAGRARLLGRRADVSDGLRRVRRQPPLRLNAPLHRRRRHRHAHAVRGDRPVRSHDPGDAISLG